MHELPKDPAFAAECKVLTDLAEERDRLKAENEPLPAENDRSSRHLHRIRGSGEDTCDGHGRFCLIEAVEALPESGEFVPAALKMVYEPGPQRKQELIAEAVQVGAMAVGVVGRIRRCVQSAAGRWGRGTTTFASSRGPRRTQTYSKLRSIPWRGKDRWS